MKMTEAIKHRKTIPEQSRDSTLPLLSLTAGVRRMEPGRRKRRKQAANNSSRGRKRTFANIPADQFDNEAGKQQRGTKSQQVKRRVASVTYSVYSIYASIPTATRASLCPHNPSAFAD